MGRSPEHERPPHPRVTLPAVDVYTCSHCGRRLDPELPILVEWYQGQTIGAYHEPCALSVRGAK